jgi:hypothetical protein
MSAPSAIVHRTAMFTLPQPTRTATIRLERAFRDYAHAYGTLLHVAWLRYGTEDDLMAGRTSGLDALRELATYGADTASGAPRMSARTLTNAIYRGDQLPPRAREALERLPSRLRQSAREHAGQSLMSYVALADAWLLERPQARGGVPMFPRRRRSRDLRTSRAETLADLAMLADNPRHERELVARLLTTRDPGVPAIPLVGVADAYGCALYYCPETAGYYARLDIGSPHARDAAPLAMHGVYVQIKSGERWASETHLAAMRAGGESTADIHSFGNRAGCLWLPIKLDTVDGAEGKRTSYHQRAIRFTRAAFLPDPTHPDGAAAAAEPVSAKLVRRQTRGKVWYQLHVTFALPVDALDPADGLETEQRPILAINRGLFHLYAAVLLSPDGRQEIAAFTADGHELLARQAALEHVRRARQHRGKSTARVPLSSRDRRQSRIADHEIAVCANQIMEVARRVRAQVVFEDMTNFASGAAIRATRRQSPRARTAAFRTLLNRRQFETLREAVDQRLALVRLPPARVVSAAYISQTCSACGVRDTRSYEERMQAAKQAGHTQDPRTFSCPTCDALAGDVDLLAARNIARKLLWLRARGAQKRAGIADADRVAWDDWLRQWIGLAD